MWFSKGKFMKFAILGAELRTLDVHSNYSRTCELRNELVKKGLAFVGVQNISSTNKCQLFLVTTNDESEIISLAKHFGQKAVLISDSDNNMEVVSTKSNGRTFLGKFEAVSLQTAKAAKFYITFQEDGKDYYFVTKKGVSCDKTTRARVQSTY